MNRFLTAVGLWIWLGAAACGSCTPSGGGGQPVSAAGVAGLLVEAGCLAPDDSAVPSVQEALASDAAPPWLVCVAEGGTVAACGVPCE